ncbi:DUF1295 domain-containing protein [Streptomyces filamentosus]|uniref:DUF1295 domain-containing protein n=1 Tax=Streptomyces filamentosus TaxID=67294 RepID=UPI00123ABE4B|nr:DUF1295 domain-containing protein [Streptomyces filamentosus]KAA6211904.1 DUF1295 domain-containing protein [Streptomyces filamentosus]
MTGTDWGALGVNLAVAAATAGAVLLATFAIAVRRGLHRIVDIAWGLAFAAVAAVTWLLSAGHGDDGRRLLVAATTVLWGLRLAAHVAHRSRGHGEDPRYTDLLDKAPGNRTLYALRTVYLGQAALVWLISLPVQAASYSSAPLDALAYCGLALWATGLVFEAVGDRQLARFKANPANRGRIMDEGLWAWTRHPNYFGDSLVWWGLYLLACTAWQPALAVLVSPVLMTLLLTIGSGKRLLEKHMAHRPGYAEYAARTSGFLPLPPRKAVPGKPERMT